MLAREMTKYHEEVTCRLHNLSSALDVCLFNERPGTQPYIHILEGWNEGKITESSMHVQYKLCRLYYFLVMMCDL